ncbi:MAG: hypothetical protein OXE73_02540 [Gammaproteobacteria bacterium]|nr:hypothetical protein [Gammaproteobacteria bacterium]
MLLPSRLWASSWMPTVLTILIGIAIAELTGWSWRVFLALAAAVVLVGWLIGLLTKKRR